MEQLSINTCFCVSVNRNTDRMVSTPAVQFSGNTLNRMHTRKGNKDRASRFNASSFSEEATSAAESLNTNRARSAKFPKVWFWPISRKCICC